MRKSWPWLFLALVCSGIGLAMAIFHLQSQLVFGYDQARDAFEAYAIWHNHNLKILGPATDIPGVFHGVLWYYFLAVVNFLGGSPQNGALLALLVFFLSVPLVGWVTSRLFKKPAVTYLTVSLYVLSPLFQVFTGWLSNPSLALLITPVLLLSLWEYLLKPNVKQAFLTGLLFGLLVQSDIAYGLLLLVLPLYLWYSRLKLLPNHFLAYATGLLIATSSFLVAELKFGNQALSGLISFLFRPGNNPTASSVLLNVFDRVFEALSFIVLPWPKLLAIVFLVLLLVTTWRKGINPDHKKVVGFLTVWFFGFILLQTVSSAVSGSAHILVAFIAPLVMIFAFILFNSGIKVLPIALVIFVTQIASLFNWAKSNYSPLSVQRGMFLTEEEKVVDYTYRESGQGEFIINTVTNPLGINTTWAYLYEFYGKNKYGYVPFWGGADQTGYLGNLPPKAFGPPRRFLIIEDTSGIPEFYLAKAIYEEDKVSDVVDEKIFGKLRVQKRVFHPDKGLVPLPPALRNVSPDLLK